MQPKTCLIIGAGISGLVAATVLQRQGVDVIVVDKGRGVGGRLASRRIRHPVSGEGVFDYGAQFFTVSDPLCQVWVEQWLQADVVKAWSTQFSRIGQTCYQGVGSNRQIAQHLAKDLQVHTQTQVTRIAWHSHHWHISTKENQQFQADYLILTPPIPQSLALLAHSDIIVPTEMQSCLAQVIYQPCLTVLALLTQPSHIPPPGGLGLVDPALAWIACNQQKGISPHGSAVTLQATPEFSQAHWPDDDAIIANTLLHLAADWLGAPVAEYQVHRWRYSQPQTYVGKTYFALDLPGPVLLAGDAFAAMPTGTTLAVEMGSHLERAFLSGLAVATHLLEGQQTC
jgi:renalase